MDKTCKNSAQAAYLGKAERPEVCGLALHRDTDKGEQDLHKLRASCFLRKGRRGAA